MPWGMHAGRGRHARKAGPHPGWRSRGHAEHVAEHKCRHRAHRRPELAGRAGVDVWRVAQGCIGRRALWQLLGTQRGLHCDYGAQGGCRHRGVSRFTCLRRALHEVAN